MRGRFATEGAIPAETRRIRGLVLGWLGRCGAMATSSIVQSFGGGRSPGRDRVVAALVSLEADGLVRRERRVQPHCYGSRIMREYDYWSLPDARDQA